MNIEPVSRIGDEGLKQEKMGTTAAETYICMDDLAQLGGPNVWQLEEGSDCGSRRESLHQQRGEVHTVLDCRQNLWHFLPRATYG